MEGYARHEQQTFAEVTEARSRAQQATGPAGQSGAENALGRALSHLFAVAEAYPELEANENFQQLQTDLPPSKRPSRMRVATTTRSCAI